MAMWSFGNRLQSAKVILLESINNLSDVSLSSVFKNALNFAKLVWNRSSRANKYNSKTFWELIKYEIQHVSLFILHRRESDFENYMQIYSFVTFIKRYNVIFPFLSNLLYLDILRLIFEILFSNDIMSYIILFFLGFDFSFKRTAFIIRYCQYHIGFMVFLHWRIFLKFWTWLIRPKNHNDGSLAFLRCQVRRVGEFKDWQFKVNFLT